MWQRGDTIDHEKYLSDMDYLDGIKQFELSINMDNCYCQNKNNYILCLPHYHTMNRYLKQFKLYSLLPIIISKNSGLTIQLIETKG